MDLGQVGIALGEEVEFVGDGAQDARQRLPLPATRQPAFCFGAGQMGDLLMAYPVSVRLRKLSRTLQAEKAMKRSQG